MNYKIIAMVLVVLVIGSFGSALIGRQIINPTDKLEKKIGDIYHEPVKENITLDKSKAITNKSLNDLANANNFDYSITYKKEFIYDDDEEAIWFVYDVTKPVATYDENNVLTGFKIASFEIKQKHWYDRLTKCLAGEMPYVVSELVLDDKGVQVVNDLGELVFEKVEYTDESSCLQYGQELTQASLEHKIQNEIKDLKELQIKAQILIGDRETDWVYQDTTKVLVDKKVIVPIK